MKRCRRLRPYEGDVYRCRLRRGHEGWHESDLEGGWLIHWPDTTDQVMTSRPVEVLDGHQAAARRVRLLEACAELDEALQRFATAWANLARTLRREDP